jgi:transposase
MSLPKSQTTEIPEETRQVARAAFRKGNVYMRVRDEFGELYRDEHFAELFSDEGKPAIAAWRLAWVTVLQFAEGLTDRQAADAVRSRIDWKYVLGLALTDEGFDYSVLSEYRQRLIAGGREQVLLERLLEVVQARGLLKPRAQARTDSTQVLASVRQLNRVEILGETVRQALNELAEAAPEWVQAWVPADWYRRYGRRFETIRLPKTKAERDTLMLTIGADGRTLLAAVYAEAQPAHLRALASVERLRRIWIQQFWTDTEGPGGGQLRLRDSDNQPPGADRLHTPYDEEARYSAKGAEGWLGYKVHVTETCDPAEVHLITQVVTTAATAADMSTLDQIHAELKRAGRLPTEHLLDAGYVDAEALLTAQNELGIELRSPIREKVSWQAKADAGYDLAHFSIDWERRQVTCPQGQVSQHWLERPAGARQAGIQVRFTRAHCHACPARQQCTRAKSGTRVLWFRPQAEHQVLQQTRQAQNTAAFQARYAQRAGIEGTLSQAIRGFDLRWARYVGQAKTHLQMLASAVALNLHRLFDWLMGRPRARTRLSAFARLAPSPALLAGSWRAA